MSARQESFVSIYSDTNYRKFYLANDRNKEYIQTVHYLLYAVVILFFFIEIYAIPILL